jgi:phage-related protein
MTDVAKEAATSTSTMEGAFGNLEAAVVGGLTDAFDTFKPAVTRAMSAAADKISSFSARATKALKGVTELVANGNFTTELREAFNIEEDNPIVAWLLDLRDSAISTFDTVKRKAGEFIQAFRDTASIQAAGKALKTVWDAAGKLGRAMGDLIGALFPVNEAMGGASGAGKMFGDAFNTALGVITSLASTMAGFGEWVSANSEPIATALIGIGAGFAVFKVATTIQAVVTALKGLDLANKAAAASQWLLNAAMNANPLILIISLLAAVAAALVYFFTQTDKGRQIWSSFTSFIGTCASNIVNFFKSIPGKIKQFFEDAKTGVTNTWNSVVDWFRGIPDRILGALGNVGNLLKNAGKAIIDGFLGGLKGAWDNVTGWIGGIGSWIADHKGPLSYDRKLLVPAGKAIMNGLAKGLKTGFRNDVENAIDRANKGVDAMRLSMAGRRLHHITCGPGSGAFFTARRGPTAGGAAGTQVTNVNVTVEGLVVDREGTARAIQKLLREYAASRA